MNTLADIQEVYRKKTASVRELCEAAIKRVEQLNPRLNAVTHLNPDVLRKAEKLELEGSQNRPLYGVPVLIKDNFCVEGLPATAASRMLRDFIAPYTATCVRALEQAGAVILGKTNMDEFGMGSSNENSIFGPVHNPWDLDKVSGGSSGGSAVGVAADFAPLALGSDTGGSVRQPASFCGVVGLKPTYGSVSRYGLIAFASSLDQAGVFARSVRDAATMLDIMMGPDPFDSTSVRRQAGPLLSLADRPLKTWRFALPKGFLSAHLDHDLHQSILILVEKLKKMGLQVDEVELPHSDFAIPTYHLIAACEASSNLARYDGVRYGHRHEKATAQSLELEALYQLSRGEGFGPEVKRRILLGTFALSAESYESFYMRAAQVRRLIQTDFLKVFSNYDVLLSPVTTGAAFSIGSQIHDPVAMYENDRFTTPASLAGLPCLSLPLSLNQKGLPLGLQLIGAAHTEDRLISAALGLEALINFKEAPRGL